MRPSPVVVILCVGLTMEHLGSDTPNLQRLASSGFAAPLAGVVPAVTTTAQASLMTGVLPSSHGIVGNGWYFRDLGEVMFWRQSQSLIQAPSVWEVLRRKDPSFSVLKHFWWYAMNTDVNATVTPRPAYHQDGAKSPDFYALPPQLKQTLRAKHGEFPLFQFWGPTAAIASTRWIAESFVTAQNQMAPDLALCYLPHLDYDLQRHGPSGPHLARNLRELDREAGTVIAAARARGARVVVVSEYGIEAVDHAVFINQALRRAGLLAVTVNATGELLDPGASAAFAVCDHQVAHIYCRDGHATDQAAHTLRALDGIAELVGGSERATLGLDHPRSGELVALCAPHAWFAYDYWLDPAQAPDFAQCVEIHRKPGYDPRELFFDPKGGTLRAALALLRKKLGMRYRMNAIPLDSGLVKGSHGRPATTPGSGPVIISSQAEWARERWSMLDLAPCLINAFSA